MLNCEITNGNSSMDYPKKVILTIKDDTTNLPAQLYALNPQDAETLGLCIIRMAKRVQNGEVN